MSAAYRPLERLAALLALAENTDNEAERDAFMEKAQKLSTLYSIGLATARAHAANKNRAVGPTSRCVSIGERGRRGLANYCHLMIAIADANNLEVTIAHNSTFVHLWGFEEDIELAQQLYGSLLQQMVAASERYLKTLKYRTETMWRQVTRTSPQGYTYKDWDLAPVPKQTARTNFQQAFADRIGIRLLDAQKEATKEAIENDTPQSAGTAVVLAEKAQAVELCYRENSNARGFWKGGRHSGVVDSAREAGHAAANSARISSPSAIGGTRIAITG
jgi:hypothetical protein